MKGVGEGCTQEDAGREEGMEEGKGGGLERREEEEDGGMEEGSDGGVEDDVVLLMAIFYKFTSYLIAHTDSNIGAYLKTLSNVKLFHRLNRFLRWQFINLQS